MRLGFLSLAREPRPFDGPWRGLALGGLSRRWASLKGAEDALTALHVRLADGVGDIDSILGAVTGRAALDVVLAHIAIAALLLSFGRQVKLIRNDTHSSASWATRLAPTSLSPGLARLPCSASRG